jgi:hypothetical protein
LDDATLHQLRGLKDLVQDAVEAGVTQTERMHVAIARYPYAVLARLAPIAAPVRGVEFVQTMITGSVYWTIRLATRVTAVTATRVLDHLAAANAPPEA